MGFKTTFKRLEEKFVITEEQYSVIKKYVDKYYNPDEYGETTICNIYYDTPDFLLIRRSISKPTYKEKLRLRTYGVPSSTQTSFVELKKKFEATVFKRRFSLPLCDSMDFLSGDYSKAEDTQISRELKYFLSFYGNIEPQFFISYDRSAFFGKESDEFRITFDRNLTWRHTDLDLTKGVYGEHLLPDNCILMEVKVPDAIPLEMARIFSNLKIYSRSFSKIGRAYIDMMTKRSVDCGKVVSKSV